MYKIKVGIDLDDVLLDTLPTWLEFYDDFAHSGIKPEQITDWDLSKFIPVEDEKTFYNLLNYDLLWDQVPPIEGMTTVLEELNNNSDIELYIVTQTSVLTPKTKWRTFFKHYPFIDPNQVITCHNKNMIDLDVLIDDKYSTLENMDIYCDLPIVFTRPHNIKHECNEQTPIKRAGTSSEIFDLVMDYLKKYKETLNSIVPNYKGLKGLY